MSHRVQRTVLNRIENDIDEILQMFGHRHLGSGCYRDVYSFGDDLVVKVARLDNWGFRTEGIESNMREYEMWQRCQSGKFYDKMKRWLAPCDSMSPSGIILLQKRTTPIPENVKLPARVPNWMTDLKRDNVGLLDGKVVFHDYGLNMLLECALDGHKLQKAEWF